MLAPQFNRRHTPNLLRATTVSSFLRQVADLSSTCSRQIVIRAQSASGVARATRHSLNAINSSVIIARHSFPTYNAIVLGICAKMKKVDSHASLKKGTSRSARLLTDSVSSDEPEAERLLSCKQPVVVPATPRRDSFTAPPSPTDYAKKRDNPRHHNYMNHLHHLIHWRDIWSGEPHRAHEVQRLRHFIFDAMGY
ncbi:unnamed protein product [Leptosia nina]|uniref:Uncharacterized protein n=1 Tax=Leptosia nina TaxID=320188 RepID=A0AAV1J8T1_9NEOP